MARPNLPRYRADVVLAVELGATDELDAEARLEALTAQLGPKLAKAVRAHRTGNPELITVLALEPSAV